jgi:diguanylate cyclase (GGDEF)-like protein
MDAATELASLSRAGGAADQALVEAARSRRLRSPSARELGAAVLTSGSFVVAAATFASLTSSRRAFDLGVAGLLCLAFAVLSQLEFELWSGSAVPTQLVFVPMLFALPVNAVPLAVGVSFVLGGGFDLLRGRLQPLQAVRLAGCAWFSLPPALLLYYTGEHPAAWSHWPLYVAALLAQFAGDFLHAAVHERVAHAIAPRVVVAALLRVFLFDLLLSPAAFLASPGVHERELSFLALLPLALVFAALARERKARLDAALEAIRLEALVNTDLLTGLANRRAWETQLPTLLEASETTPLAICVLDLDHFKAYNDEHGHPAGDELMVQTATAWCRRLRPNHLLARLGGDEFALALPGCDAGSAHAIVELLHASIPFGQTCSAGVACHRPGESAPHLMQRADSALYQSKRTGRNRTTHATGDDALRHGHVDPSLARAVELAEEDRL